MASMAGCSGRMLFETFMPIKGDARVGPSRRTCALGKGLDGSDRGFFQFWGE